MSSPGTPRWAVPVAIVVGLVAAAAVLGLLLRDGGDPVPATTATVTATATPAATQEPAGTIGFDEGRAVPLDSSREALEELLGPPGKPPVGLPMSESGRECAYYAIRGEPRYYQFCFDDRDRLASAVAIPAPRPGS